MGLFESIFGKSPIQPKTEGYFKTLTAYQPAFRTWSGSAYESELVRSAIDARARHISKLKIELVGSAKPKLQARLKLQPNEFMTWGQFLYRVSTILDMQNTAFILPVFGEFMEITGFYPVLPSQCEVVQSNGEPWIRYTFKSGDKAAVKLSEVGILTKYQYEDDFFGSSNAALAETMNLLSIQKQGVEEAIKNSATYRFMAQLSNFAKAEDLAKERKRFSSENFSKDVDAGGLLLFPNTYSNIQQIHATNYSVDTAQVRLIQGNVYNYFGVNEKILQNIATGDEWASFYEGAIEVFAIQLSDVLTKMIFSVRERATGNCVQATANRLQYMSARDKLAYVKEMGDRGFIKINEAREVFNLPPVDGGDVLMARGEYKPVFGGNDDGQDSQSI